MLTNSKVHLLMPDLWRHMVELSVELEKLDDAGNYRERREAARQRGNPQRPFQAGSQTRPVLEHQNHLARILDVIPGPPQEYRPSQPRLPATRQEVVPAPRQEYQPSSPRLPARQDEYIARGYARRVTQIDVVPHIDVVPMARDWRPRPIQARKTSEWRNYLTASCFGAVIGVSGYAFLSQSGAEKGEAAKAPSPAKAVASAVQQPGVAPDTAFRERVSNQLYNANVPSTGIGYGNQAYRGEVPGAGAGYGAMAQSPGEALIVRASNQLPPREAPRVEAPSTVPQQSDDALLAQAFYKLSHGDGLGARAAYETVAQHGSSLGAFGLAETYDPNVLARRRVLGLKPDASLARMWYEKAAKLGSAEASLRLKKLTKPPKAISLAKPVSSSQAVSSGSEVLRR